MSAHLSAFLGVSPGAFGCGGRLAPPVLRPRPSQMAKSIACIMQISQPDQLSTSLEVTYCVRG